MALDGSCKLIWWRCPRLIPLLFKVTIRQLSTALSTSLLNKHPRSRRKFLIFSRWLTTSMLCSCAFQFMCLHPLRPLTVKLQLMFALTDIASIINLLACHLCNIRAVSVLVVPTSGSCFSWRFDCIDSLKSVVLFFLLSDDFLNGGVARFCGERLVDYWLIAHFHLDSLF